MLYVARRRIPVVLIGIDNEEGIQMSVASPGRERPANPKRRWSRELDVYPDSRTRYTSLGIVVVVTIVLYYQLYLNGGVAVQLISDYGLSFRWFVMLTVASLTLAAAASYLGGFTDRFGRANVITGGLVAVSLISAVAIPMCESKWSFAAAICALNAIEGVVLVAAPALVRDFSPQLGRASAMGFWTMGPVLGSVAVTSVVGASSSSTTWHTQYSIAGVVGLAIAVLSLFLKELAPGLRDQIVVEEKDRALVQARMRGIDVEHDLIHPTRKMLKADIVLPSIALSLFLTFYIGMVAFGATYFEVNFGYSQSSANKLLVWGWVANAIGLIVGGWFSDRLLVRKPFMLLGAVVSAISVFVFAERATSPETAHSAFVLILVVLFVFSGVAHVAWMAAFTETVERRNPALTATGLAIWAVVIRATFAIFIFVAPFVVDTVNPIADHGATVQEIASGTSPDLSAAENKAVAAIAEDPSIAAKMQELGERYSAEFQTAGAMDSTTSEALMLDPLDTAALEAAVNQIAGAFGVTTQAAQDRLIALGRVPRADLSFASTYGPVLQNTAVLGKLDYLRNHAADVQKAVHDGPAQWQTYWRIAGIGMIIFIPMIWLMAGSWRPRKARDNLRTHEEFVAKELAKSSTAVVS